MCIGSSGIISIIFFYFKMHPTVKPNSQLNTDAIKTFVFCYYPQYYSELFNLRQF